MAYMDMNYEKIVEKLNLNEMAQIIVKSFGGTADPEKLAREKFFYLYLRTLAGVKKLEKNDREYKRCFWKEFLEYANLLFERYAKLYGGNGNLYTNAMDLLTFTEDYALNEILFLIPKNEPQKYIHNIPVGGCIIFAAVDIAKSFTENNAYAEAGSIIRSLLKYSEQRVADSESYAYLLVEILANTFMTPSISGILIGRGDSFFRSRKSSQEYHNFLWFKHCHAQLTEKTDVAKQSLLECAQIRKQLFGLGNWVADYPTARYDLLYVLVGDHADPFGRNAEELSFVERFLDSAQANIYENWQDPQVQIAAGYLMGILLQFVYMPYDLLPQHKDLIAAYSSLCDKYHDLPEEKLLKKEVAQLVEGARLFQENDLIQAEQVFHEAVQAGENVASREVVPPYVHKINLLIMYFRQTDFEHAIPLAAELLEELDPEDVSQRRYWCQVMSMRIGIALRTGDEDENLYRSVVEYVDEVSSAVRKRKDDESFAADEQELVFLIDAIVYLSVHPTREIENSFLLDCLHILQNIEANRKALIKRKPPELSLYYGIAALLQKLGDQEAVSYAKKTVQELRKLQQPAPQITAYWIKCIDIVMAFSEPTAAKALIGEMLTALEESWHASVKYYNNARLEAFLTPAQNSYRYIQSYINKLFSEEESYEFVLRNKALASLAGRERNRFLRNRPENTDLIGRINRLQDKIATAEVDAFVHENESALAEDRCELRELEATLAGTFPDDLDFIDISLERVLQAVPDNCAVIEYHVYTVPDESSGPVHGTMEVPALVDAYLIIKGARSVTMEKRTIPLSNSLIDQIEEVVDVFLRESLDRGDPSAPTEKEITSRDRALFDLYDSLVRPFQDRLTGIKTLFIAPDLILNFIPFEILKTDRLSKQRLSDSFSVVRIDSARDFLFCHDQPQGKERLILGNPKYDATSDGELAGTRLAGIRAESVKALPFSEFEAEKIAEICNTTSVVGRQAVKSVLKEPADYGLIHLATHGFFDPDLENDAVYSSFLLFAGAKSWMRDSRIDPKYGNGIITADEISRLDLRKVKLVVLSACYSGMTDPAVTQNLRGLLGGFAAAGVQYVITHQWSADDMATAVLMSYFYDGYIRQRLNPEDALMQAKLRLRETTIKELEAMGVVTYGISHAADLRSRTMYERLRRRPPTSRPFASEYYWGGFACHRCW